MTELGSNGEESPDSFLHDSIGRFLENQTQIENLLAEQSWNKEVSNMVRADFRREVLPARQQVWDKTVVAMQDNPSLKVEQTRRGKPSFKADWIDLREQEGRRVEVTTAVQVLDWEPSDQIDLALKLLGHKTQILWGVNLISRRSIEVSPPTILGVEPISRSRRLQYPHYQIERALGHSIVNRATHLRGSLSVKELGSDADPEIITQGELRRLVSNDGSSSFDQVEDSRVFSSKENYLKAMADAGQSGPDEEIPKPLDWEIGTDFESFMAMSEAIETSRPAIDDSMDRIVPERKILLLQRQAKRFYLGYRARRLGVASWCAGFGLEYVPHGSYPAEALVLGGAALIIGGTVLKPIEKYDTIKLI